MSIEKVVSGQEIEASLAIVNIGEKRKMSIKRRICNVCGKDFPYDIVRNHNEVKASVQVNTPFLNRKKPGPCEHYCWFVRFKIVINQPTLDICDDCAIKQMKIAAKKLSKRDIR